MRHPALRSTLALLALAACGEGRQQADAPEVITPVQVVAPQVVRALAADDGTLLAVRAVVAADGGLLVLDGASGEVWRLALDASGALHRVASPRGYGQADVYAMADHPGGLSVLGIDGTLRVMDAADGDRPSRRIRAFEPRHRPLALGEWTGGWAAVHALVVVKDSYIDSVIVSAVDSAGRVSRLYGLERSGPGRPGRMLVDPVRAHAFRDRIVLVGADPARVVVITPQAVRVDTLRDVPERALSGRERRGLDEALAGPRAPAALRNERRPSHRPAAVAALPLPGAFVVVAQGGEEAKFADLYCGGRFRRTLLARPDLNEIFVVESGLVAIDDPPVDAPERPLTLSFYRSEDLLAECAK